MFDLKDKVTAVTGAASGIGLAIADAFARANAIVYLIDRDSEAGKSAARSLAGNAPVRFIEADVSRADDCRRAAETILAAHQGRFDVLVNNAGVGAVGALLETDDDDFDRLYAVNVKGVLHMTRPLLPAMIARRKGSVVNMASIGGVVGIRDRFAYCATKFAVVGMTKCMALDYAETAVRFNCICPGRVETPWVAARIAEYPDPEAAYRQMAATQALGRMGAPEEIAAAAVYLAADESAFVTGSALIIDGGFSAGK